MKLGIICTMINGFGRRGFYNTQEIGLGRELVRQGHAVTIYKCVKKEGAGEAERVELGDPGCLSCTSRSLLLVPMAVWTRQFWTRTWMRRSALRIIKSFFRTSIASVCGMG